MPSTVREACDLLGEHESAIPVAGGTDLCVHWPQTADHEGTYLDLSGITDLPRLAWSDDELVLGGLTTYWDVIRDARVAAELPLLTDAARQVGAVQIQTRGTWAGNIANASPAADGVPVLMAYDAVVVLESVNGREEIELSNFYLGYRETRRRPDQLIVAIRVPRADRSFHLFEKVGSRAAQAITKVGVAVTHGASGWRVVANSVAPVVCRCPSVEGLLESGASVKGPADLASAIDADVSPIDDFRSTAEYRERVLARVLYHGLLDECPGFS
jgi:carbon-monoxide dehydrogenase small subunit/xanthine dehydrogenase small subunit